MTKVMKLYYIVKVWPEDNTEDEVVALAGPFFSEDAALVAKRQFPDQYDRRCTIDIAEVVTTVKLNYF